MRSIRTLIALSLAISLAGTSGAFAGLGKGANSGKHYIHGQVVSVQMDANGKGSGTITVLVHHHKKGATSNEAPVEKTFKVSNATTYAIVQGKKGAVQQQSADVSAVQKGSHVLLTHNADQVSDVKIVRKGKGNKKNV
jgi:hypothetical protein